MYKTLAITRTSYEDLGYYLERIETALNEPPTGYETHSWQCLQETNERPQSTLIFYEQEKPKLKQELGRKFKGEHEY